MVLPCFGRKKNDTEKIFQTVLLSFSLQREMTHPLGHKMSKRQRISEVRWARKGSYAWNSCTNELPSSMGWKEMFISSTRNEPNRARKKFSLYCKLLKTVKAFAMISFLEIFLLFFKSAVGLMEKERHRLCTLFGLEKHCKVCLHISNTELSMAQYMIFE